MTLNTFLELIEKTISYAICLPYHMFTFAFNRYNTPKRRRERMRKIDLTPPKFQKRKRALTPPLKPTNYNKQEYNQQLQSPLFGKLPPEIRALIWTEVILLYTIRQREITIEPIFTHFFVTEEDREYHPMGVMGMLRSCRAVYAESVDLLYTTPTFVFWDYHKFLGFYCQVLEKRWHRIRGVRLRFTKTPRHLLEEAVSYVPIQHLVRRNSVVEPRQHRPTALELVFTILGQMQGLRRLKVEGRGEVAVTLEGVGLDLDAVRSFFEKKMYIWD